MDTDAGTVKTAEQGSRNSPRRRWWSHLILLGAYPLVLGVVPQMMGGMQEETLLPEETVRLLAAMGFELGAFALIFAAAWFASRATAGELMLHWHKESRQVLRGFVYSILLRLGIAAILVIIAILAALTGGLRGSLEKLRPRTEAVVDPSVLVDDPVYFLLTLTVVSFLVGGLREELWRAGMVAGMRAVFPKHWRGFFGDIVAITVAAVIFGLGHLPQGWGGAAVTALLGFGLGMIMVRHHSIWEAVFAHGFFNATSFLLLYYLARTQPDFLPLL